MLFSYGKNLCHFLKISILKIIIFSSLLTYFLFLFSCNTVSEKSANSQRQKNNTVQQLSEGLSKEIRTLIETGIYSSLIKALDTIRDKNLANVDYGRLMTGIINLIVTDIYPDSVLRIPVVDLPQTYNYTQLINEAQKGNYTRPNEKSGDFFEYIIYFHAVKNKINTDIPQIIIDDTHIASGLCPQSVLPPFFRGLFFERSGKYNDAETAYRQAYNISGEFYPALIGIARVYGILGRKNDASALYSELILQNPDNWQIKKQLALILYENKELLNAISLIDEILIHDKDDELLLLKAKILLDQNNYSQANSVLDNFTSNSQNNRSYLFMRARIQFEGNRNRDAALNYLRSIIRIFPDDTEALIYASRLLMDSNRASDQSERGEYLRHLQEITGINESSPVNPLTDSSIDILSLSLRDAVSRENWREAQPILNKILTIRRTAADLLDACYVEKGLGNNARFLSYARELYETDISNNDYLILYISALIDNARKDDASRLLESRLSSASGSVKSRLYYQRSRLAANDDNILTDLRSSLFEDPRNLETILAFCDVYHRRREERRVVYYLKQALAISPDNPRVKQYEKDYASSLGNN